MATMVNRTIVTKQARNRSGKEACLLLDAGTVLGLLTVCIGFVCKDLSQIFIGQGVLEIILEEVAGILFNINFCKDFRLTTADTWLQSWPSIRFS